ncbi:HAD-superfamily hydrolase, subfamily IIB [Clostridium pasteurianum DSM 525 = ATCC 6013]|uniref:Cof-like hydrolase n=1 Tax=Clostridium pasteurianum DSM 525 = ATCC 6013 TaxID=1262449 RepID=A0A0H3J6P8_CLOPA|nr:Cof-type HAD-IIB family hydrolase [Clostridium pasteurianum]AJA48892.1 HAD-superfamily hydrolase, subfamily IIB [Clostridium pasteurianum DSM 525 = ATCC 6013]AJA52880.1 HAD-superfamily hydrolase, subfamily IIB [Clostridium pasteurianum DSM 525 = ATCC 6013]AOZ76102.1 HAD family hydrolase [Clostridium pasteurianum DSM 525 = ATCC 6013]AOZ79898.1 HAD family hydrolase [Clostridium pasteurianum]ELP60188.1 HAD superfamily hydrolase [Clostridium pasteurianum DSM 525 = ATCC 6013]
MSYKLICIDMDGTLLDDKKEVSEKNLNALREAIKKGVKIAVCTGRLFASARYYAELIGVKAPVIASNGAYIREKDRNDVIYELSIGVDRCKELQNILNKYKFNVYYNKYDSVITKNGFFQGNTYAIMNKNLSDNNKIKLVTVEDIDKIIEEEGDDILKCICISDDYENLVKAKDEILKTGYYEVVSSNRDNIEIMIKGVSKGRAVKVLADFYNILQSEVICIGDNENDFSMIEFAGLGVAMGNATDHVKKIANYITDTNNEDGVAKVIEKFVL